MARIVALLMMFYALPVASASMTEYLARYRMRVSLTMRSITYAPVRKPFDAEQWACTDTDRIEGECNMPDLGKINFKRKNRRN